jgi:hypothetical protein
MSYRIETFRLAQGDNIAIVILSEAKNLSRQPSSMNAYNSLLIQGKYHVTFKTSFRHSGESRNPGSLMLMDPGFRRGDNNSFNSVP